MDEQRCWVVTASADHASRGMREGIVQAGHGKAAPLRRMQGGDGVVNYSPRTTWPDGPAGLHRHWSHYRGRADGR